MLAVLACCLASAAIPAAAQKYPDRPIRVIVPFPPGGGSDTLARTLAQRLSEAVGQPVIVDNKSGAAGNTGAASVAKAPADGYTLLLANNTIAINAALYKNLPFDLAKDFAPVSHAASTPVLFATHPSIGAKSVRDVIALAKKSELSFGSCGNGTSLHLAGELLSKASGIKLIHVPYKGCAPALSDAVDGHVPLVFNPAPNVDPYLKQGRIVGLAVASPERSALLPGVPTMKEEGYPTVEADLWYGFFAPAATPPEVIARLNVELKKILDTPAAKNQLLARGFEARHRGPDEFQKLIQDDIARWARLGKEAGLQLE